MRAKWIDPGIARVLTMAAAIVLGGSAPAVACPVCFGAEETSMIEGSRLGAVVLLGITLVVQGAFVAFFVYLRKSALRNADLELDAEWLAMQKPSRTS